MVIFHSYVNIHQRVTGPSMIMTIPIPFPWLPPRVRESLFETAVAPANGMILGRTVVNPRVLYCRIVQWYDATKNNLENGVVNLVGGFNLPLWKMMEWKWVGMMIPNIRKVTKFMFQTTNQQLYVSRA